MNDQSSITKHQNLVEILRQDYAKFPEDQTYEIYADDVYFKDPLNEFRGVDRYRSMIGFLGTFFRDVKMEVHNITQEEAIVTEWTLHLTSPLPWKPRLAIPGWSKLTVNEQNLIASHVDYWHISPWEVLQQNFLWRTKASQ